MENSIRNTRTEENLLKAFAGESQARNRYTFFAKEAKKAKLMQIAGIFEETACQEKEHAERFFKFLEGGMVSISAEFPAGMIQNTAHNLAAAAAGEYDEWHDLYPEFAEIAREEGFAKIGAIFDFVCIAEKQHEKRFRDLLWNLENDLLFRRPAPVVWRCLNCGFLHTGTKAPERCPSCDHEQGYFEILAENW